MNQLSTNIEDCEKAVLADKLPASSGSAPTVNPDQECWVKDRIMTAIRMSNSVRREAGVRADDAALQSALDGIANGTAVEIIRTLGMEPEFVNLRPQPTCDSPVSECRLAPENKRLRAVMPKILEALESGSCVPGCSLEFLEMIPNEVSLVISKFKRERLTLALLASPAPQFFNPMAAFHANNLRDQVLEENASKPSGE